MPPGTATPVGRMRREFDDLLRIGLFYPTTPVHHLLAPSARELVADTLDPDWHRTLLSITEECGYDYVFMADTWATYGPVAKSRGILSPTLSAFVLGAYAAACTNHIGIVNTMHLLYLPPVVVARYGGNLDALTKGRWGINIVSGSGFAEGLVPEPARSLSHDERYELAEESMTIIRSLWAGEQVDHHGAYFDVEGDLIAPLPVQNPHPYIVSAGASGAGLTLAARHADCLFVPSALGPEGIAKVVRRLEPILAECGRTTSEITLQTNLLILVRDTDEEAQELAESLRQAVDIDVVREMATMMAGVSRTYRDLIGDEEREDEALRTFGATSSVTQIAGSPATVAEALIALHAIGIRGMAINLVLWQPDEVRRFGEQVLPLLEEAGVWASPLRRGWRW